MKDPDALTPALDVEALLDGLEQAVIDNPRRAAETDGQLPAEARSTARYHAIAGNNLRHLGFYDRAEEAFEKAKALDPPPFDDADRLRKLALLRLEQKRYEDASACADEAVALHRSADRQRGLPGPPDRGLAAALVVRGYIRYMAHLDGEADADLWEAGADFRDALELAPDPREAPLVHAAACFDLALVALESGVGLTLAQRRLWQAERHLSSLGLSRSSPPGARLRWTRTILDYTTGGSSNELGVRFRRRILRALEASRQDLIEAGAAQDAVLVGLDVSLILLEDDEPDWSRLRSLSADIFRLDWSSSHEMLAGLLMWRQACLEGIMPEPTLTFTWQRARGLLKPDLKRHAHGEWMRKPLVRPEESLAFRFGGRMP